MFQGWKILIFNTAIAIIGVFAAFDWTSIVSNPEHAGLIVSAIGVINVILRFFTSTPPGQKKIDNK